MMKLVARVVTALPLVSAAVQTSALFSKSATSDHAAYVTDDETADVSSAAAPAAPITWGARKHQIFIQGIGKTIALSDIHDDDTIENILCFFLDKKKYEMPEHEHVYRSIYLWSLMNTRSLNFDNDKTFAASEMPDLSWIKVRFFFKHFE